MYIHPLKHSKILLKLIVHCTCTVHVDINPQCSKYAWHVWSFVTEQFSALDSSSGGIRMWVRIPYWIASCGACVLEQDTDLFYIKHFFADEHNLHVIIIIIILIGFFHRLMKFLRRVINNWFNFALTPTCIALYTQCFPSVCVKNFTGDSGGIRTHDLLLTSADVLTSRPPSLPDDDRPARILYSSEFRDIHRLMKFLRRVINKGGKQEVVGSNPARVACKVFSPDTQKALSIQCYARRCKGKIKSKVFFSDVYHVI